MLMMNPILIDITYLTDSCIWSILQGRNRIDLVKEGKMYRHFLLAFICMLFVFPSAGMAKERKGEIVLTITIDAPEESKDVRVWIPYPVSNNTQDIADVRIDGNFSKSGIYGEKETGNLALYAEWTKPLKERVFTFTFNVSANELIKKDFPRGETDIPVEVMEYLKSTIFIPTDGKVLEIAQSG